MKEILAVIRPNKVRETKQALLDAGISGYTGRQVRGRGKESITVVMPDNSIMKTNLMHKREMLLVVEDSEVDKVISVISKVNSTGSKGDGKIFVSPVLRTYTISQGK